MGGTVSSRGRFERQFNGRPGKANKGRRDSNNRPVLKLRISMRASQKIKRPTAGETSLDHPILRRPGKNGLSANSTPQPPCNLQRSQPTSSSPHSSVSSDSMVIVKYIDSTSTEETAYNPYCAIPPGDDQQEDIQDEDHLCWFSYGRVPTEAVTARGSNIRKLTIKRRRNRDFSETDNGQLRFKDVRRRILDHIDPYETIKKCSSFQPEPQPYLMFRSQSTDAILEANSEQEATNLTTGEKTRSTGILDEVDQTWIDVDVELVDDDEEEGVEWTLGESIMRQLDDEGLFVCDVENPQKDSEKEVVQAWPNLKSKMKRWRSLQSLDGTTMDKPPSPVH